MELYYIMANGEKEGPYPLTKLKEMQAEGIINMNTQVWNPDSNSWGPIAAILQPSTNSIQLPAKAPRTPTITNQRLPNTQPPYLNKSLSPTFLCPTARW